MFWSKSRYAQERGFPLDKEGGGLAKPVYRILFGLDDQNDAAGFGGLIPPPK